MHNRKFLKFLLITFIIFLPSLSFATNSDDEESKDSSSEKIKFQDVFGELEVSNLLEESPEEQLKIAYYALRKNQSLDDLEEAAKDFKYLIYDPIDMLNIGDQKKYIELVKELKSNLAILPGILSPYFEEYKKELENRLCLAKIDQQLFEGRGRGGDFNHPSFSEDIQNVLNKLIGKIFHIIEERDDHNEPSYHVRHVGSAILAKIDESNQPVDLSAGNITDLTNALTCSHVIESKPLERLLGIYFVPNDALDSLTGFPPTLHTDDPLNDIGELMYYLRNSPDSYLIDTYTTRKRVESIPKPSPGNKIKETNPQYLQNEDIVSLELTPKFLGLHPFRQFDSQNISVSVKTIRENLPLQFDDGNQYFAIGYPGCDHYDLTIEPFSSHAQHSLIDDRGYSPLIVTSALAKDHRPLFSNGIFKHDAPVAEGMSGGSLLRISGNQIDIFGVISQPERGCY